MIYYIQRLILKILIKYIYIYFFNPQQVGIDKGDIPDLTQVSASLKERLNMRETIII